ncbi:MAG: hypothetical protein FWC55_06610 [Firmicutes bacterium]|nr:hypothetical protein [Bacillota bacterium]
MSITVETSAKTSDKIPGAFIGASDAADTAKAAVISSVEKGDAGKVAKAAAISAVDKGITDGKRSLSPDISGTVETSAKTSDKIPGAFIGASDAADTTKAAVISYVDKGVMGGNDSLRSDISGTVETSAKTGGAIPGAIKDADNIAEVTIISTMNKSEKDSAFIGVSDAADTAKAAVISSIDKNKKDGADSSDMDLSTGTVDAAVKTGAEIPRATFDADKTAEAAAVAALDRNKKTCAGISDLDLNGSAVTANTSAPPLDTGESAAVKAMAENNDMTIYVLPKWSILPL